MKNVTLSVPDETLRKAREYAKNHGTTLNELIREFLKNTVEVEDNLIDKINASLDTMGVDTKNIKYRREDLYDRESLR